MNTLPHAVRLLRRHRLLIFLTVISLNSQFASYAADDEPDRPIHRIAFGSCIRQDQPMPILHKVCASQPEICIFLGDNIYADTEDMAVMKAKYDRLAADEGFQRLRKQCQILATWDDHDFGQNDAGRDYPHRVESQRLFLDFWQDSRDSPRRQREGIYHAYQFGPAGRRLQVILLDTRYFRDALDRGERRVGGPYQPTTDRTRTMLGETQWKWLRAQLEQPAEVRILASSIQCVAEDAGQECWSNMPHERERLFRLIDETQAGGIVMISGDRHWAEVSRCTAAVPYPLIDVTSSSLNQPHARGTPTNNRFRWSEKSYHQENFGLIQVDWSDEPQLTLQILDHDGSVVFQHKVPLSQLQPSSAPEP